MRPGASLIAAVLIVAFAAEAAAQQAQEGPEPGVVAVRYFQCPGPNQGEAVRMLNGQWRSAVQELIDEGGLLDYGILTHAWGDEWNVLDYFVAEDLVSFHQAFETAFDRVLERAPEEERGRFGELCPGHKDNIYFVVPPPSPAEPGGGE